jgi:hypothetical protein
LSHAQVLVVKPKDKRRKASMAPHGNNLQRMPLPLARRQSLSVFVPLFRAIAQIKQNRRQCRRSVYSSRAL